LVEHAYRIEEMGRAEVKKTSEDDGEVTINRSD
jgi:hypothetical protein